MHEQFIAQIKNDYGQEIASEVSGALSARPDGDGVAILAFTLNSRRKPHLSEDEPVGIPDQPTIRFDRSRRRFPRTN